jgi:hypothetical protein
MSAWLDLSKRMILSYGRTNSAGWTLSRVEEIILIVATGGPHAGCHIDENACLDGNTM